ncbi:MAG: hypothetical protein AABZ53_07540 [Planctomycetota bacterium]
MQKHTTALSALSMGLCAAFGAGGSCLASLPLVAPAAEEARHGPELDAQLNKAMATGDWVKVEEILDSEWAKDPDACRDAAHAILRTASMSDRIVAVGVLARNAKPADLGALAFTLRGIRWADERRILVRAIGARAAYLASGEPKDSPVAAAYKQDAYEAIKRFFDDEDMEVQAAAFYAIADLGMGQVAGDFISRISLIPAIDFKPAPGLQLVVQMAMNGAVYELSGVRPSTTSEISQWFRQTGGLARTTAKYEIEGSRNAQPFVRTPSFDVYYHFGSERRAPQTGWLAPKEIVEMTSAATLAANIAMAPIVGPIHMPVVRLLLCDKTSYGARTGTPFLAGVTQDNEIIIRVDSSVTTAKVLTHEYVHMIQTSMFVDQPRWLFEGLASSVERSAKMASTRTPSAPGTDRRTMIDRGVFKEAILWTASASSDRLEPARYENATLAIDFLRFGGFPAANERLNVLMGKLSRGGGQQRALEETYGMTLLELEERLRKWLEQKQP